MHAHVAVKRPTKDATKIWLTRSDGRKLAHNKGGIPNRDLRDIMQFVAVSQYNGVARLIGAQEIVMADDEYAVCNNVDSLAAFSEALASSEKGIDILGSHLKASGTLASAQLVDDETHRLLDRRPRRA